MWLSVDRVEGPVVILVADNEQIYHLDTTAYESLTGFFPQETHMLWCEIKDGTIQSAHLDLAETERRISVAKARLQRLINKKRS